MNCQKLKEQENIHHPRIAKAMFNIVFVGVVRGLRRSKSKLSISSLRHERDPNCTIRCCFAHLP